MLKRIIAWFKRDTFVRVVVAIDPGVDRSIAVVEVYRHDDPHAWNAFYHFKEVYGGANVTCASRRILRLGPPSKAVKAAAALEGPVVPRRAPGDPRMARVAVAAAAFVIAAFAGAAAARPDGNVPDLPPCGPCDCRGDRPCS